mgnify:CR=1 FL=1
MRHFAGLLGSLIVLCYGLTIMNFIFKWVNKKYAHLINKNLMVKRIYKKCMGLIIRNHKIFGGLTIIFISVHFGIFFSMGQISITGIIAALLMVVQVILGAAGAYIVKSRKGVWFALHRFIAASLAVTIFIHTAFKI